MLDLADCLFYFLAFFTLVGGLGVLLCESPLYSALSLALCMIGVSAIFLSLNAAFVAAVQLIVYAGAVIILFTMVLMLFDLKHEAAAFSKGLISGFLKLAVAGSILGIILGSVWQSAEMAFGKIDATSAVEQAANAAPDITKLLATALFTKYVFAFEVIGFLLLVVAIGAVTLSRSTGGTHHVD
jgi:NADH-quinone oxidoreductase subunit J